MTRILIADDHGVVRRGIRDLLEAEIPGVVIAEAADAREITARLAQESWDLVVLDINLPGRNGLEVLEDIRRSNLSTPVLVLTAYPEGEFALRAFQLGAAGYLNKQTAFDELLTAVRRILSGGKYVTLSLAEQLAATIGGEVRVDPHQTLSSRELQVLRMIATGQSLKQISRTLGVSAKTVATYRARMAEKMGVGSRVELARYAWQHKLVD